MTDHPYKHLPDKAFWRRSVAAPKPDTVDPTGLFTLRLEPHTRVATAGSCFAQHIARHLSQSGYNYYIAETGHPILSAALKKKHNYGTFSARYGNIYTARQLLQLFQRAFGSFTPVEEFWTSPSGAIVDPFRPTVQPGGFISREEMEADRAQHLRAVRNLFETLDVFVFTLGLTECWRSKTDGAVFPLCPGVEGGAFDDDSYEFYNQSVTDVIADMTSFLGNLRAVNPACQIILTVSPVPLAATADPGAHVLSASTYSKSVLRVAAEELRRAHDFVHYFPSYEIITGAYARGRYYADDLRNVTETGVEHVMGLFLRHAGTSGAHAAAPPVSNDTHDGFLERGEAFVKVECDEIALDRPGS